MSDAQGLDAGRAVFLVEATEILEQLEESLLELEESPDNSELVGSVFRALHTIKGSGAMFGFDRVSSFTHEVETVFDEVRSGNMEVSRELIDLTLRSRDIIRGMLGSDQGEDTALDEEAGRVVTELKKLSAPSPAAQDMPEPPEAAVPEKADKEEATLTTWRIRFKPPEDVFSTGTNPLFLLEDLRELGDCDMVSMTDGIPRLSELDPERFYFGWDILLTTDKGRDAIEDVFIFIGEDSDLKIEAVEHHNVPDEEDAQDKLLRLGDILVMRGELDREQLSKAVHSQKRLGEILVERGLVTAEKIDAALREQNHLKKAKAKVKEQNKQKPVVDSSIRVPSSKLDELVNLVGELVTVQARLSQLANGGEDGQLKFLAEEVERLSAELRDNTMNIRMVPIGATFTKFRRLVRDLSSDLGREVILTTVGEETELDKTVIEKLNDPMVHLIRNALDHGVEPPDKRVASGKKREGSIHLEAEHSGAHVFIRVRDDGAGINKEKIRKKAIERGLMEEGADISDDELYSFIFSPGFSTAVVVSSVSGRGVGMDVVRTNIDALRGSVDVKSVEREGTTVTLKIPLTLAIIEGLLTRVGEERYVLPLSAVEECVELVEDEAGASRGRNLAHIRGELIPYVHLRRHFNIQGKRAAIEQIVITHIDGHRIGFVVDEVIGQHQTVIKNLGHMYRNVKEISGATILGDGTLALILDVPCLVQEVQNNQL
ncbi:chemotaxis protein CheA [Desulfopila aestuarii]|uniref:Chemotaxis protein CheA n=1 Tax=Desulfopila aestuarii DSM 18488 TaxID=1121416 RepID=A0A1M7XX57_9BACT|nr:chemotaxis protein CheA [Desulfopila aestuarii]SHO43465.1 CheA signal transduction histidine kinase [Desulfopila aestuarii DSM 18488]